MRRTRRALRALLGSAAMGMVAPLAAPVLAAAQETAPVTATLGPLVRQTLWVEADEGFELEATLTTSTTLTAPSVVVRFGDTVDRGALVAGMADGSLDRPVTRTVPDAVLAEGVLRVALASPGDAEASVRRPRLEAGVHPVVVELRDAGTPVASLRTHLVVLPDPAERRSPLGVAVLLSHEGPPTLQPDGTIQTRPDDADWFEAVTTVLQAAATGAPRSEDPPVASVLVGPEIAEGLATGGDDQQAATITAFTTALTGHEILLAPWVPLDEALWIATGDAIVVDDLREHGAAALTDLLAPPTADDIAPLDVTAGPDTVDGFSAAGIDRFLVEPDAVVPDPDAEGNPPGAGDRVGLAGSDLQGSAFVLDRTVTGWLTGPDPVLGGVTAAAELAAVWFEEPERNRAVVLAPDTATVLDGRGLTGLLVQLADGPILDSADLDTLFDRVPISAGTTVDLVDEPSVPIGDLPERRAELLDLVTSYEGLLGGEQPLSRSLRDRLDAATADGLSADTRTAYLDAVDLAITRGTQGITIPEGQAFNLTSRSAVLELRVENGLGYEAHTLVRLDSDTRLELPDGADQRVVLEPGENVLELRVRARSTGASEIDVTLLTPDGTILLAEGSVRVRSTALTGVALILGGGAVLVLLVWWTRQILAARRQRRAS